MKTLLIAILLHLYVYEAKAQIQNPVKWSYGYKRVSAKEVVILLKASIDDGWHIFSQHVGDNGPTKTKFTIKGSKDFKLIGSVIEPKAIVKFEDDFKMNVSYFENEVIFEQKITLLSPGPITITGRINYGTCNAHQCLPPEDVNFSIVVK